MWNVDRAASAERGIIIASDLHIGSVPEARERDFYSLLNHALHASDGLIINGDLFDLWFEHPRRVQKRHLAVLSMIRQARDAGLPMLLVGGNHDPEPWMLGMLRDEYGLATESGPLRLTLAGHSVLLLHGHEVVPAWQRLAPFIYHPIIVGAARRLPPSWLQRVLHGPFRHTHRGIPGTPKFTGDLVQAWAVQRLREDSGLELVVAGHVHLAACAQPLPGKYYLNLGDWIGPPHILHLKPGKAPALENWGEHWIQGEAHPDGAGITMSRGSARAAG